MILILSFNSIFANVAHDPKADSPIISREFGKFTVVSSEQNLNACSPISVTVLGIVTLVIDVHVNEKSPILVTGLPLTV